MTKPDIMFFFFNEKFVADHYLLKMIKVKILHDIDFVMLTVFDHRNPYMRFCKGQ